MPTQNQYTGCDTKKAVLVTGGAGYMGAELVKKLATIGQPVVSMYRHRIPEPRTNVFPVCSDLSSEELLAAPLRGIDVVVHLAWENCVRNEMIEQKETADFPSSTHNIILLKNLISAMEKAKTKRIIFISAFGASSRASSFFLREKYAAEFYILNSKIPEKIILRSSIVYGGDHHRDKFINSIKRMMRFPGFYPVPSLKQKLFYPIHIHDFIESIGGLITSEIDEPVKILDIIGEEALRIEEIFKQVSEKESRGGKVALGSFIGQALLPLFDNENNDRGKTLRYYLSFGREVSKKDNVYEKLKSLHKKSYTFREGIKIENENIILKKAL